MNCAHKNCKEQNVLFFPTIKVWVVGYIKEAHDPATIKIDIPLCLNHKASILDEIFKDPKDQIKKMFALSGKVFPDFSTAEVEWDAVI